MTATESNVKELPRQKTGIDLNTFDEVLLKKVGKFVPVATLEEAKHRVGGNTEKFISIINEGLEAEAGRALINDTTIPWQVEDEEGALTPFSGMLADEKLVNGLVLNMAKNIFGYSKEMSKDEKREAKQAARELIKSNDQMKQGLMKYAVAQ